MPEQNQLPQMSENQAQQSVQLSHEKKAGKKAATSRYLKCPAPTIAELLSAEKAVAGAKVAANDLTRMGQHNFHQM